MASAPDDHSFNPLPSKNILEVVKLTHVWPIHLKIIHLTLCHPELVKSYLINIFMVRASENNSVNPLPIQNISKVVK